MGLFDTLKQPDIPTTLRICAGTDGSVTYLLELMTKRKVRVVTRGQAVVAATPGEARLVGIRPGEPVNRREVVLEVAGVPYVLACSLTPIDLLPAKMKDDLMRADIPIGRILRKYELETRRDIQHMEIKPGTGVFSDVKVLSREYVIIHGGRVLMWINELFPIDNRWDL